MEIPVEEVFLSIPIKINFIIINKVTVELNTSVTVSVTYLNEEKIPVNHYSLKYFFIFEGEKYSQWGNDDNYLLDLVMNEIGVIPILM